MNNLFEAYFSVDEEMQDIDELQEEFESESVSSREENFQVFDLEVEDMFEDWDSAERQVENYAKETGFEVKKSRLEKNKEGEIVRRTFTCKCSGKYRAQKRADVENTRERESVKKNCPWRINLRLTGGIIHITSLCKEHNHPLHNSTLNNHRLTQDMLEEIEFLVSVGCGVSPIIRTLQKRFPTALITPKSVYNAICQFRRDHKKLNSD
jgi:hypothetical protein